MQHKLFYKGFKNMRFIQQYKSFCKKLKPYFLPCTLVVKMKKRHQPYYLILFKFC